ncbi:hypothetical protein Slin14017_G054800 [Septoria linicola]|nr:hypothetical protein Slin14017_G054800 [Septoria linicola]
MSSSDDDSQIVSITHPPTGYPDPAFDERLRSIILLTRTSTATLGSGISALQAWLWDPANINVRTAQMAEHYADLILQRAEDDYRYVRDEQLPRWDLTVEDVLGENGEHVVRKPRRYGEILRGYRVKIEEVAAQVGVMDAQKLVLEERIERKAKEVEGKGRAGAKA